MRATKHLANVRICAELLESSLLVCPIGTEFSCTAPCIHVHVVMYCPFREPGGSVVECLTRDRGAAGSSLAGATALWSLSKTHLS